MSGYFPRQLKTTLKKVVKIGLFVGLFFSFIALVVLAPVLFLFFMQCTRVFSFDFSRNAHKLKIFLLVLFTSPCFLFLVYSFWVFFPFSLILWHTKTKKFTVHIRDLLVIYLITWYNDISKYTYVLSKATADVVLFSHEFKRNCHLMSLLCLPNNR